MGAAADCLLEYHHLLGPNYTFKSDGRVADCYKIALGMAEALLGEEQKPSDIVTFAKADQSRLIPKPYGERVVWYRHMVCMEPRSQHVYDPVFAEALPYAVYMDAMFGHVAGLMIYDTFPFGPE